MSTHEIIMLIIALFLLVSFLFLFSCYFRNTPNKSLLKDGKMIIEKTSIFYKEKE